MDQVQLANLALACINARTTISALSDTSAAGIQIRAQYAPALEAILQAAHWNFARAQASLALLKDATKVPADTVPSPWLYEYALPADCVQARYVMPMFDNLPASVPGTASQPFYLGAPVRFLISTDIDTSTNARRKVLLTNQPDAILIYTARITDCNLFDGSFVQAFAHYLGALVGVPLTGNREVAKMAWSLADNLTKAAQASNGNEGLTVIDNIPDWIRVRGYAADWAYPPGSTLYLAPQSLTMIQ